MVIWPLALDVGRAGFQPHHMRLLQLKFRGVLAGNHALVVVDVLGETVEQRGFFPEPVPPEIRTLARQRPMICRISAPWGGSLRI